MRHYYRAIMVLVLVAAGAYRALAAVETPFSRYQIILDRKPFGEVQAPAQSKSRVKPTPAKPPFVNNLRMCAITDGSAGVRVGLVDISRRKGGPQSIFLYVGQTSDDGITVVEADFEGEGALLSKGDEEHWIYMGGAPPVSPVSPANPAIRTASTGRSRRSNPVNSANLAEAAARMGISAADAAATPAAKRLSYAERLRMRRNSMTARKVEAPKLEGKQLEEHLKKYQMDLIRKGMPPLPMPLTKEMDDQLVKEGVLPPAAK